MKLPDISGKEYKTDTRTIEKYRTRKFCKSNFCFYLRYFLIVIQSGIKFFFVKDPQKTVVIQSRIVMRLVEKYGAELNFSGLDNFPGENGPYVFACNHMGTLEVNALPGLVASRIPMTFVVKESLLKQPFFGRVLKRLKAIPVARKNPGEDLRQVLTRGKELLEEGYSVILFPEGTRQDIFDPVKFNSLAVKLALRAGVSVVPVALKTDFWGVGRKIKEVGPLSPEKPVYIKFGEPVMPEGKGKTAHSAVLDFIKDNLIKWNAPVAGS